MYVMGKPYAADTDRMTEELLRQCIGEHKMLDTSSRAFMGVDVGRPHWGWIAEYPEGVPGKSKVLWAGEIRDFNEIGVKIQQYRCCGVVIDANPEREKAEELAERFLGKVFLAFYPPDASLRAKVQWNEQESKVAIHRTFIIDSVMARIRTRRMILPRDISWKHLKHFLNVVRLTELDTRGNPVARWIDDDADHLLHAAAYCETAAIKFGAPWDVNDLKGDTSFSEPRYAESISRVELGTGDDDWGGGYQW
jgi:hypothetical protein